VGQVYSFTDSNGETRLFAEITPDPTFDGGTVAGSINVAEPSNLADDLLLVTEPAGYAANSNTGNVLRITDGSVNVLLVDAYGGAVVKAPAGQGTASLQLRSTDNASYLVELSASGINSLASTGLPIFQANAGATRLYSTQLGFYGHASAAQPVVPLTTPSIQNVIDALVATGLIVQHD
jgi:hypothetical protein